MTEDERPNLGLATTTELIAELAARAEVSKIAGEAWPDYRTVDEPPIHVVHPSDVPREPAVFGADIPKAFAEHNRRLIAALRPA